MFTDPLSTSDPKIHEAILNETRREQDEVLLIASENYVSRAVLEAQGSIFTNKYAEGYPSRRYYGGCEFSDVVESLAIERAKEIFNAEHVNVQPHSGSQANMAAYMSVLKPGDTILGMSLSHGGHLTHGAKVSFSGSIYNSVTYGVKPDGFIDYEEVQRLLREHAPRMIVVGASAYARILDFKLFSDIAKEGGAYLMADIAHIAGLVAAGLHPSPVPYADFVTTTTHKTLRGPRGGMIMCKEQFAKGVDKVIFPGIQGGPLMHVIAAKAVAFKEALTPEFKEYQAQVIRNAARLASELVHRGYNLVSGGTDNHLMLIDLSNKDITGKEAENVLGHAGITLNKNAVPYDTRPPAVTSGIRIGTPCVTTRGMREDEMVEIAGIIDAALNARANDAALAQLRTQTRNLCNRFPIYK